MDPPDPVQVPPIYNFLLALTAMIILGVYGCFAVTLGRDSFITVMVSAGVAGLGGYRLKSIIEGRHIRKG